MYVFFVKVEELCRLLAGNNGSRYLVRSLVAEGLTWDKTHFAIFPTKFSMGLRLRNYHLTAAANWSSRDSLVTETMESIKFSQLGRLEGGYVVEEDGWSILKTDSSISLSKSWVWTLFTRDFFFWGLLLGALAAET